METPKSPKRLYEQASRLLMSRSFETVYGKIRDRMHVRKESPMADAESLNAEEAVPAAAQGTKMEDVEVLGDGTIIGVIENQKVMFQTNLDTNGFVFLEE